MNIYVWHPQVYNVGVPYSLRSRIAISNVPKATVAQIAHHALEHCSVADLSDGCLKGAIMCCRGGTEKSE